jgi:hypothetical protein
MEDYNLNNDNIDEINEVANNLKVGNNNINKDDFEDSFDRMKNKLYSLREKIIQNRNRKPNDLIDIQKLNKLLSQTWGEIKPNPKLLEIKNLLNVDNYLNKYNYQNNNILKLRFREKSPNNDYYVSAISGRRIDLNNINSYTKPLRAKNNFVISNKNKKVLMFEFNLSQSNSSLTGRNFRSKQPLNKSSSVKIIRKNSPFNKEYYKNELNRLHHKLFSEDYFINKESIRFYSNKLY